MLPGLLTIPRNTTSFPIVILVHGSGPNDRDETIGPNKPLRDLAFGLASFGIASIRYDKRTLVYGEKIVSEGLKINLETEVLIDVTSAIRLAKSIDGVRDIYIIGHSLGSMLSPKIASENNDVAGIVMMAGNARPLEDLIIEQYSYLFSHDGISEQEENALNDLKVQIDNLDNLNQSPNDSTMNLPLNLPASYWKSLMDYNQLKEIKSVGARILILQGERDYQVTMQDFNLWKKALKTHENVDFKSYPKLNHLFLEGEGKSYPTEYQIESNIPQYVITDIANWIMDK